MNDIVPVFGQGNFSVSCYIQISDKTAVVGQVQYPDFHRLFRVDADLQSGFDAPVFSQVFHPVHKMPDLVLLRPPPKRQVCG